MKKAFTLAEVLITLTIIGVIAAITIPNLMQKWGDHADVVKVKEAYSILNNAMKMYVRENGAPDISVISIQQLQDGLSQYLKVAKILTDNNNCYGWKSDGSQMPDGYCGYAKDLNGKTTTSGGGSSYSYNNSIMLENGMLLKCVSFYNYGKSYFFLVDINGAKKPNQLGYDVFAFEVQNNTGLVRPMPRDTSSVISPCEKTIENKYNNGMGCTKWAIYVGNLDYKYRSLSEDEYPKDSFEKW